MVSSIPTTTTSTSRLQPCTVPCPPNTPRWTLPRGSSDQTCYSVQCAAWGQCEFGSPHQDVDLLVTESVLSVGRRRGDPGAEQPAELYMTVAGQAGHSERKHGHGHQHQHHTNT